MIILKEGRQKKERSSSEASKADDMILQWGRMRYPSISKADLKVLEKEQDQKKGLKGTIKKLLYTSYRSCYWITRPVVETLKGVFSI